MGALVAAIRSFCSRLFGKKGGLKSPSKPKFYTDQKEGRMKNEKN